MGIMALPLGVINPSRRKKFIQALNKAGVETREFFPCLANQPSFKSFMKPYDYPQANEFEKGWFYIPCHQFLKKKDPKLIANIINKVKL